ncbi:MAG: leucyl/phenylalanyl-tRNA--protein transferase [Ignavibacteriae bacterium]|nr:leucyl/phenylalanyl-tRNA--protein transferase [Ignavibacteriota bacterium]
MLTPDILLDAYRIGFFPMAESRDGPLSWYSPDPRGIIPLRPGNIPRSVRKLVRDGRFEVRFDTSFEQVMRACAEREETWISEEIIAVYTALFKVGYGHSVEAWEGGALVGGLYGVAIGGAFFGESMFSRVSGTSKVALASLIVRLEASGFSLLDSQYITPHLAQFGAIEVPRIEYLALLENALEIDVSFND